MPTVAAVVPHWNRRDLLAGLLESLRAQTRPFDEILIADNGSTDGSADFAEQSGARVLRLERNVGFAAAMNRGIAATRAEWVAILNNDVTLDPNWLQKLLAAAERENVSFATGKVLRAGSPGTIDGTFDEISQGACAHRCGSGKPDSPLWNQPRRIRFAPMTAAIFRRELFEEMGGLDELFGLYLEDVEFGLRCAMGGQEGCYEPAAVAFHLGSATLGEWNSDTVRWIARNQVLLAAKHFRGQRPFRIVAGQLLWGLVALRHGRGWSFLKGKLAGIRSSRGFRGANASEETRQKLASILEASERSILLLQRETGFDTYWRIYFRLVRR